MTESEVHAEAKATSFDVDIVVFGGPIVINLRPLRETHAVAVARGRVVAHGNAADHLKRRAKEVFDLAGRAAIPGLHDAHVHPVGAGVDMLGCDLSHCSEAAEYPPAMRSWMNQHPGEGWVTATGWDTTHFTSLRRPMSSDLDEVSRTRPIFFRNADGHSAWVNSRALSELGITSATPDPPGGRIERDPNGTPTGVLHDSAIELAAAHLPAVGADIAIEALQVAQAHLHSLGVVGWQDALVGPALGLADPEGAYLHAAARGLLTARVTGALRWDPDRGLEQISDLVERRADTANGNYQPRNVKLFLDGVPEAGTSALLEPYCCSGPAGEELGTGPTYYEPGYLNEVVELLDQHGFGAHFHALGDRSLRDALNAVETARAANGPTSNLHQAAHVYLVREADFTRFAALGVVANLQMLWASGGDQANSIAPFLGRTRSGQQFPFRTLLDHHALLAAGSDWPVTSPDPWQAMHVAVNRNLPGVDAPPLNLNQALTPVEALHAYTRGSAVAHGEHRAGTLEIGATADIAVLDRHPLRIAADGLAEVRTVRTYVAGRCVHTAVPAI